MASPTAYFLGNRIRWSVALVAGPIAGAIAGEVLVGIAVVGILLLPTAVLFDADRPWWSDEVKRLPRQSARSRAELRKLNLWSALALLTGLAIAFIRPWV